MTRHRQRTCGFTLIELMIVLAMLAILASLAAPSFQRGIAQRKVSETASDLMIALLQARNAAITNNQSVFIAPFSTTDWSRGWRIFVDTNNDGAYTAGTDTLISNTSAKSSDVSTFEQISGVDSLTRIGFDSTGYLVDRKAGRVVFASSVIPSSEYRKGVVISRVGRARLCEVSRLKNACSGDD